MLDFIFWLMLCSREDVLFNIIPYWEDYISKEWYKKKPCNFIRQGNAKIKVNSILIIPDMFCILVCNGVIGLPVGLSPSPSKLDSVTNLLLRLSYIA